ncbi:transmembrane protein 70, mitochondrial [Danio rerio]|uniref:Transmembrane protein 70 n=1 Tax=Danio rerio TaxID=7955 RepID=E7FGK5_DANRE|nr:transmembrane protein 70, mitochondrial [Danio rerio]|eukprot:XP_002660878.1 transmembrane protein 70, mitochondrial [Danio rerio]
MYQVGILHGLRRLSKIQQQIIRNVQIGVRPASLSDGNVCSSRVALLTRQDDLLHVMRRSFLKAHANKVQSCCAVRWYNSSPVQSEDGDLIYSGNLGKAIRGVKLFSYSSSMFSLCVMPFVLMKTGMGVNSLALQVAFCGVIGFFTFLTPALLHFITKGYVIRLYHNKETDMYTAITYSAVLLEKRTVFHQSDVTIPDVSRMFTSFYAKKRSMLVNPMHFSLPHDYNHLMGYDRPFSFDMDDFSKPDKN